MFFYEKHAVQVRCWLMYATTSTSTSTAHQTPINNFVIYMYGSKEDVPEKSNITLHRREHPGR